MIKTRSTLGGKNLLFGKQILLFLQELTIVKKGRKNKNPTEHWKGHFPSNYLSERN